MSRPEVGVDPRAVAAICEQMQHWARNVVHLDSRGAAIPSVAELKRSCRGPMPQIYSWLTKHAATQSYVQYARTAIEYSAEMDKDSEVKCKTDESLQTCHELEDEIMNLDMSLKQLESEMELLEEDVLEEESKIYAMEKEIMDTKRKDMIFVGIARTLEQQTLVMDEYADRMHNLHASITKSSKHNDASFLESSQSGKSRSRIIGQSSSNEKSDSECEKILHEACDKIVEHLTAKHLQPSHLASDPHITSSLDSLVDIDIQDEIYEVNSANFIKMMCTMTAQASSRLCEETKSIDLKRDAELLKLRMEEGQFQDNSQTPSVLKSVQRLLQEMRTEHMEIFMEKEKLLNKDDEIHHLFNQTLPALQKRLAEYPEHLRPLISNYFMMEIELHGEQEVSSMLKEVSFGYAQKRDILLSQYESVKLKYDAIQEFDRINKMKQIMIERLIKQNLQFRISFGDLQRHSLEIIDEVIGPCQKTVTALIPRIRTYAKPEVVMIYNMPLDRIRRITIRSQKMSYSETATALLSHSHPHISAMYNSFSMPRYLSVDKIPERLIQILRRLDLSTKRNEARLSSLSACRNQAESRGWTNTQAVTDIQGKVKTLEKLIATEHIPEISAQLQTIEASLKEVMVIAEFLQEWWSQPAQYVVPWVTVGGLSVKDWMIKWRALCSKVYGT